MEEIDKFLEFLYRNIEDDRISLHKEKSDGIRYYHIDMTLEQEVKENQNFTTYNELRITVDCGNECVIMYNSYYDSSTTTIESRFLVEKWSIIFEKYLEDNIDKSIKKVINNTMTNVKDKDLFREYQMEKIFKDDESV